MSVGVPGVEMIYRNPVEPSVEVGFHPGHEPARDVLEILVLDGVLGRDDESELMPVAVGPFEEGGTVGPVELRVIEVARQPFAGDPIALQIAQMDARPGSAAAGHLDQPGLDHDAALSKGSMVVARREHAPDAGAAADAVAVEDAAVRR